VRRLIVIAIVLMVAALVVNDGALATALGAIALVVAGIAWFEAGTDSTRELAVVATLAAGAAAGRVLFAAIPGVQPVTVIAIVAGASLGLRAGVATGALAAFVSNLFLGQGIWTPQQMLGWGLCGAVGALLGPALRSRWALAAVSAVLGFAFSMSMDVWLVSGSTDRTPPGTS
jgi:energy-coupling factor transport system substrate-specific component